MKSKATIHEQVVWLIEILQRRPDECCEKFCDILSSYNPDLADLLRDYTSEANKKFFCFD